MGILERVGKKFLFIILGEKKSRFFASAFLFCVYFSPISNPNTFFDLQHSF